MQSGGLHVVDRSREGKSALEGGESIDGEFASRSLFVEVLPAICCASHSFGIPLPDSPSKAE